MKDFHAYAVDLMHSLGLGRKVSAEAKVRPSVFQSILYYQQFLFVLERVKSEK
jgi:hypothetical protein